MSKGDTTDDQDLPKAVVNRLIKAALPDNVQVASDAKLALAKAAKIFILYASACSNDFCMQGNRSTISANDVLSAIEELELESFKGPLIKCLEAYKKTKKTKKDKEEDGKEDEEKEDEIE
eukprot:TRINITY_DN1586_c0_g1_i1.p1 TRINITY_DN1586_c0_g1~~TRINITY_DN1586_c0_g1_i1.p1  ORF type:complete len:136 (-),score=43.55 TRINITY_DN1586_c0_g1_i1:92-451(-)